MYDRPAFLEPENYSSYEEYYKSVTGQTLKVVCPYCGTQIPHAEAIKVTEQQTCSKCGGRLLDK